MLDRRKREREIRNSSSYDEELWLTSQRHDGEDGLQTRTILRSVNLDVRAIHCVSDFVTNMLMKVQHIAVTTRAWLDGLLRGQSVEGSPGDTDLQDSRPCGP